VNGTYVITAEGKPNAVTFSSLTTTICSVGATSLVDDFTYSSTVTFLADGLCTISADIPGDDVTYAPAQKTQTIQVGLLAQSIEFASAPPAKAIVGATYTPGATATSGLPVDVTVKPSGVCTLSGGKVTFVGTGLCQIHAAQAGNDTYKAVTVDVSVAVTYAFEGFASPVDNNGVLNSAKAGQAIPFRWRLTGADGLPITNLTSATIAVKDLACAIGSAADQVEEYAAGESGLQNLGSGYYQINWKTPASYKGSCKTLTLTLGSSETHSALFQFTK
jgi:hypothetical protein